MLATLINLGSDFTTSTLEVSGQVIADLSPYLVLVVGVLLSIVIVSILIRAFLKH